MKLKNKVAALATAAVMTAGLASAANIGVVNINAVAEAYPGIGALEMQVNQVESKYNPQLEKESKALEKLKTDAEKQKHYAEKMVPIIQKANDEINKIMAPVDAAIAKNVEAVRVQKGIDVVVNNPAALVAADQTSTVTDITADVVTLMRQ